MGDNLFAESWGILFTVLLLTIGIELREHFRWKPLKDRIFRSIGYPIRQIFLDLKPLIKMSKDRVFPSKKENIREKLKRILPQQLKELNDKEKIELSALGKKFFTSKRHIDTYTSIFQQHRQSLNDLEIKYSDILKEPKITKSIIDIQSNLEFLMWFIKNGDLYSNNTEKKEEYFEALSNNSSNI